jgi:hypothetical protein
MWRSTGAVFAVLGVLALGAAAAAVAALNQQSPARKTITLAGAPPPAATPPPATAPPASTPTPATPAQGAKQSLPAQPAKLPKIPLTPTTTPAATTPAATTPSSTPESSGSTGSGSEGGGSGEESEGGATTPSAFVLDTDAASTYNPYGYPASSFGDPSLTIDGDHSTAWTAQVDPANAPAMAEGVLINLKSTKHLGALELVTASRGMVVQVYGSAASKAPSSITEHAWVPLTAPLKLSKTSTHFKLRKPKQAFRFVTVWISRAPNSAIGTPSAPGHVGIGEIELFPPS